MNSIVLKGIITSDLIARKTKQGTLFCKFTLQSQNEEHECWYVGKDAAKFAYDIEKGTELTLNCLVNHRMQIAVQNYEIINQPLRLGQVFDYQNKRLLVTENMF